MNKRFQKIIIVLVLQFTAVLGAQDKPGSTLARIKEKVQDVQVDKNTFRQSVNILDESKGKLNFISEEVDDKGRSSKDSYEFYVSDLDKNTIIRKTSGKKLFVSLTINNNQKFIKHSKDDKLDGYISNIEILSSGADDAQALVDLFRESISQVKSGAIAWNSDADALNWLKSNIKNVNSDNASYEQSFSFSQPKTYLASFTIKTTDQKGASTEEKYEFNIMDLNEKDLSVKVSATELSVPVKTRGNNSYIRYTKGGELQNFTKGFEIIADNVEQARDIAGAFSAAIEKSKPVTENFPDLKKALDFITGNTRDVTLDNKTVKQTISFDTGNGTKSTFTSSEADSKGNTVEERYEFYLDDLDAGNLDFKVSGKKITINPSDKDKNKFIRYFRDNVSQDFQNDFEILTDDIEAARSLVEAFKSAIKGSEVQPEAWKSTDGAIAFLAGAIKGESAGTDSYTLDFSAVSKDPLNIRYLVEKKDNKGAKVVQTWEFYPFMLDPATVKTGSSGRYLEVEAGVRNKSSFIKVFKEDKQQAYDNDIKIMSFDARQAQKIAGAIQYLADNSKPPDKVWNDKQSVSAFLIGNISDLKGDGEDAKQKFSVVDNDPCKISLSVSTTDGKGRTTDQIFEFTLSDMDKGLTDIKVSGKNVEVTISCKNKQKLVKVYKNGEQQAWGTSVSIGADDVEKARNIAEAFRNAITQCEK